MGRIRCLDYIKTVALTAVVFYHIGFVKNGYFGVEAFFIVSGFLFAKSNQKAFAELSFRPSAFLFRKIASFLPLILAASALSLLAGYFLMLPDDYENLAESVIASSFFANNVLQSILSASYWDIVNTYKPLMHTWYIGALLQSYLFLSVSIWGIGKICRRDVSKRVFQLTTVVSLILYFAPGFFTSGNLSFLSDKFYAFPFRLYETTAGALLAYYPLCIEHKKAQLYGDLGYLILIFVLFCGLAIPTAAGVLLALASTALIIAMRAGQNTEAVLGKTAETWLSLPGRCSFDVYIWHQVLIAFSCYCLFQSACMQLALLTVAGTAVLSFLSVFIRKKIRLKKASAGRLVCCASAVVICALSAFLYCRAGVVRDVPELDIDAEHVRRGMHSEYVDVPFNWDRDFTDSGKTRVLVIGNSFGRDFANILNESALSPDLEISYLPQYDASDEERTARSDFIFLCAGSSTTPGFPAFPKEFPREKLYYVGGKRFGTCNGILYVNRNKSWYYDQTVPIPRDMLIYNYALRGRYGDHFIDMIAPVLTDRSVRAFTDDHFFISQDCRHLTKRGAQYYARILDLSFLEKEA